MSATETAPVSTRLRERRVGTVVVGNVRSAVATDLSSVGDGVKRAGRAYGRYRTQVAARYRRGMAETPRHAPVRTSRLWAWVAAVVLLVVLAATAWFAFRPGADGVAAAPATGAPSPSPTPTPSPTPSEPEPSPAAFAVADLPT